jgi:FkbM family methyltransferase
MKQFTESLRYEIEGLGPTSIVMDVGAHKGDFAAEIHRRYGCTVHCYEPVPEFFNHCVQRFAGNPKIKLWGFALGDTGRPAIFGQKGDMSGEFCTSPNNFVNVHVLDVAWVITGFDRPIIDLVKLNCENGEYGIMERILDQELHKKVNRFSIQFHTGAPDYARRHASIRSALAETHDMEYDEPYVWEGWVRR